MVLWFGLREKINQLNEELDKEQDIRRNAYYDLIKKIQVLCPHKKMDTITGRNCKNGTLNTLYMCEVCKKCFIECPKGSKVKTVVYK